MSEANWFYTRQVLGVAVLLGGAFLLWLLRRRLAQSMNPAAAVIVAIAASFVCITVGWYVLDAILGALR